MMKGKLKGLSMVLVAITVLFAGNVFVLAREVTNSSFIYDTSYELRLGDLIDNGDGTYSVPITGYTNTTYQNEITFKDDDVYYAITALTKEEYEELAEYQEQIDELLDLYLESIGNNNAEEEEDEEEDSLTGQLETLEEEFSSYINEHGYWCYKTTTYGTNITFKQSCEDQYYIVTVDAFSEDGDKSSSGDDTYDWNYHAARVYKIEADTSATCSLNNPTTGIQTPYIIVGIAIIGATAVIIISKKKKYI